MPDIDDPFLEELEPVATQQGIDVPGSRSGFTDFVNFGIFNGNFRVGPPQAASDIDVATSLAGSNFLPGWRFVQSSNTTITGSVVASTMTASGSNFRFTISPSATVGDKAYLEQIVDIGGSATGDAGGLLRVTGRSSYTTSGAIWVATQYLAGDGSVRGMPAEQVKVGTFSTLETLIPTGYQAWSFDTTPDEDPPPAGARYMRYRIVSSPSTASAGSTVDIYDVRRERAVTNLRLTDRGRTGINALFDVYSSGSNLFWQPTSTTTGATTVKRLLNAQLVPVMFSLVNVPANATTDMQLWGDTALGLATPRIGVPWGGWIVGCSYRTSAVPTAGGGTALRIRVQLGGTTQWTPFTLSGSGLEATNDAKSVDVGTYTYTANQQLGVAIETSGTYTPTTADMAVVVWLAVRYDGA